MTEISCLNCATTDLSSQLESVIPFGNDTFQQPAPKKIFLLRHGQSVWNRTGRVIGQSNPGLSASGQEQASRLEEVLRYINLTAIYTSTLDRSVQTAAPTARMMGLRIIREQALCEQHMGIAQDRYCDERDPEAMRYWLALKKNPDCFSILGGESFYALRTRVSMFLETILQKEAGGVVLIVGHSEVNRAMLETLLGWSPWYAQQQKLNGRFLYEIVPGDEPAVRTISLRGHDLGMTWKGFRT